MIVAGARTRSRQETRIGGVYTAPAFRMTECLACPTGGARSPRPMHLIWKSATVRMPLTRHVGAATRSATKRLVPSLRSRANSLLRPDVPNLQQSHAEAGTEMPRFRDRGENTHILATQLRPHNSRRGAHRPHIPTPITIDEPRAPQSLHSDEELLGLPEVEDSTSVRCAGCPRARVRSFHTRATATQLRGLRYPRMHAAARSSSRGFTYVRREPGAEESSSDAARLLPFDETLVWRGFRGGGEGP